MGRETLIPNNQLSKITTVIWTIMKKQTSVSVSRRSWKGWQHPMETGSIFVLGSFLLNYVFIKLFREMCLSLIIFYFICIFIKLFREMHISLIIFHFLLKMFFPLIYKHKMIKFKISDICWLCKLEHFYNPSVDHYLPFNKGPWWVDRNKYSAACML